MPGFNYGGGVGDGTSWSSERGSEPTPGGGGTGHSGDHDNSGSQSSSVTTYVMKPGDSYSTAWGQVIINAAGQPTMFGTVMTYENSSLVPSGKGVTRVLNSLINIPVSPERNGASGKNAVQVAVDNYLAVQSGSLPSGYWLSNGKVMWKASETRTTGGGGKGNEHTITVTVDREAPALTAAYNEGIRLRKEAAARSQKDAQDRQNMSAAVNAAENTVRAAEKAYQDAVVRFNQSMQQAASVEDRAATYYGSDRVSRKALVNMYRDTIRTGSIPAKVRGNLRQKVQAMLDEDARLAGVRAAAKAELNRTESALANARQGVVIEKQRQQAAAAQAAEEARRRQAAKAAEEERQRQTAKAAEEERKRQAAEKEKDEREVLEKTSELVIGMGDQISEHIGDKYKEVAKAIASDIKNFQGKTIRNFDDAMASLNKVLANPDLKINQADRDALVNAWKHVDAQDMANKLSNMSKAFTVADLVMKVEKIRAKSIEGYETGNWSPLMLEVESWVLSGIASVLALGIFSATLGVYALSLGAPAIAVGIAGILLAAAVGALIDDKFADALNNEIIRPVH